MGSGVPEGLAPQKEPEFYRFGPPGSTNGETFFYAISIACKSPADAGRQYPPWANSGKIRVVSEPARHAAPELGFDDVKVLASDDMKAVDDLIRRSLQSDVLLVSQVAEYIVTSGGKRIRPLIVLLAARALGYDGGHQMNAAAIIEFIHTATLLHDDVVDSSDRRRGRDTANTVFGNQASVLVGDFLYSRAFQMMVEIGRMRVMEILADATNTIAAGEVMQLMNVHDPDVSEENYRMVIYRKTARLFEAGAQIAAVLAERDPGDEADMISYGQNLGTAFQLVDDALDYDASPDELGKNLGDDLAEGKPTLPLIYAMEKGTETEKAMIRAAIVEGGLDRLDDIQAVVERTGALQYTAKRAQEAADRAIDALANVPESKYKQAMIAIADFAVRRRS
jgi:octaprenyl-diphosphate synthase